jgi:DNA-binding NarL/FixJ family response regulator
MIKVIIVEDDELQRSSFAMAIELRHPDLCVVGEAETGAELFALLHHVTPDIILLDIKLPDMSGVDIARRLKSERPDVKILAISYENDLQTVQAMLDAGIEGFISKRQGVLNTFHKAVQTIMEGAEYFGADISQIMYHIIAAKKQEDETPEFTPQETRIIELAGEKLSGKEIADRLCVSLSTVNNHKNNMFRKFGFKKISEAVQYAAKKGIIKLG